MLKNIFLVAFLGALASGCSNETTVGRAADPNDNGGSSGGGNPTDTNSFVITAASVPSYSRNSPISIPLTRFQDPSTNSVGMIHVHTDPNCVDSSVSSEAGLSVKHNRTLDVPLKQNVRNTISVIAEFVDGTKSPCTFLAETIHDNVAPPSPVVAQSSYSVTQNYLHIPVSNLPTDAKSVLFYKDGALIRTVSASLWRNNQGYLPLTEGETIQVFMAIEDHAGNVSGYSPVITISQSTSSLAKPILTSLDGYGQREGILLSAPELFIRGSVEAGQTFAAFMHPNLATPIFSGTASELLSGVTVPVATDATSTIYVYAIDSLSNKSSPIILRVAYASNPSMDYDITQTSLYPSNPIKANRSTDVVFRITNASIENSTGARVPVTTFSITTPDGRISIDSSRGCSVSGITPSGGCDIHATVNLPFGAHAPTATIQLNGVTITRNFQIEISNPIIKTMSSTQKTSSGEFLGSDPSGTYLIFQNSVASFDLDNLWTTSAIGQALMNGKTVDGDLYGIDSSSNLIVVQESPDLPAEKITRITEGTILKYYTPFALSATVPDPIPEDFEYPSMNLEQTGAHTCRATLDSNGTEKTLNIPCQDGVAVIGNSGVYTKSATGFTHTDLNLDTTSTSATQIFGDIAYFENSVYAVTSAGIVTLNQNSTSLIEAASGSLKMIEEGVFIVEGSSPAVFYRGGIVKLSGTLSKSNVSISQRMDGFRVMTFPTQFETAVIEHVVVNNGAMAHSTTQTKIAAGFGSKVQATKVDTGVYLLVGEQSGSIVAVTANSSSVLRTTGLGTGSILGGFSGNNGIVIATNVGGTLTLKTIGGSEDSHVVDHSFLEFPNSTGWVRVVPAYNGYGAVGYQTAGGYELVIVGTN